MSSAGKNAGIFFGVVALIGVGLYALGVHIEHSPFNQLPEGERTIVTASQDALADVHPLTDEEGTDKALDDRDDTVCKVVNKLHGNLVNWGGTVHYKMTETDGTGHIVIEMGDHVFVTTNEWVPFNPYPETDIKPKTPAFADYKAVHIGDKVHFTGHIVSSDKECAIPDPESQTKGYAPKYLVTISKITIDKK